MPVLVPERLILTARGLRRKAKLVHTSHPNAILWFAAVPPPTKGALRQTT